MPVRDRLQAEANLTVATAHLAAAADEWGAYLEGIGTGANVRTALSLRSKLADAAFAYHKAKQALAALIFAPSDGVTPPGVDDGSRVAPLGTENAESPPGNALRPGMKVAIVCPVCQEFIQFKLKNTEVASLPSHADRRQVGTRSIFLPQPRCEGSGRPVVLK